MIQFSRSIGNTIIVGIGPRFEYRAFDLMMLHAFFRESAVFPLTLFGLMRPPKKIGGQAVIEGVMMRGRHKIAWAVREPGGSMVVEKSTFISVRLKSRYLRLPVIRGAVNLYESLVVGYRALSRSAEIAMREEAETGIRADPALLKKKKRDDAVASWTSFGLAMVISLGVFMYAPMWIVSRFVSSDSAVAFNSMAGLMRIVLLLAYLVLISLWSEMQRIFEYHGAEHKAIYAFEDGKELSLDNMRPYTTLHPRCGTSFLLLVALLSVLLFSVIDAVIIHFFGPYPNIFVRFSVHLLLVPLVAGSSFEVLKLSDRHRHVSVVGMLIRPGLWLQKITTRQPDDRQLEVAAAAVRAVL